MITVDQEQRLGQKTFMLLLARKTAAAFVLLFAALLVLIMHSSLAERLAGAMAMSGTANLALVQSISSGIAYVSLFLFLIGFIALLFGFIVSYIQYRNYAFTLSEFDLRLRRGVFSQKEVSIPYRQIQAIDIVRTIPYRFFGVSRLIMITAGHEDPGTDEEADTVLDPIDKGLAEEIRAFLDRKIGVQIVEGTVQADKEEKIEEKIA